MIIENPFSAGPVVAMRSIPGHRLCFDNFFGWFCIGRLVITGLQANWIMTISHYGSYMGLLHKFRTPSIFVADSITHGIR